MITAREFALWCALFGSMSYGILWERGPNNWWTLPALALLTSVMGTIQLSMKEAQ
jgi:hypothetical protein